MSGLDDVVAAETVLSDVDGESGRLIRPRSRYVGPEPRQAA